MLTWLFWSLIFDEPHSYKHVSCARSEREQLEAAVRFAQSVRRFLTENGFIK